VGGSYGQPSRGRKSVFRDERFSADKYSHPGRWGPHAAHRSRSILEAGVLSAGGCAALEQRAACTVVYYRAGRRDCAGESGIAAHAMNGLGSRRARSGHRLERGFSRRSRAIIFLIRGVRTIPYHRDRWSTDRESANRAGSGRVSVANNPRDCFVVQPAPRVRSPSQFLQTPLILSVRPDPAKRRGAGFAVLETCTPTNASDSLMKFPKCWALKFRCSSCGNGDGVGFIRQLTHRSRRKKGRRKERAPSPLYVVESIFGGKSTDFLKSVMVNALD